MGWCTNHRTSVPHTTCGSFYQLDQAQLSSSTLCRRPAACSISGNCLSDNLHSALEERFLQSCPFLVTLPVFSCNPSGGLWSSAVHVTWEDNMMLPFYSCLKLCNRFQRNTEMIAVRFEELCSLLPTLIQLIEHVAVLLRPAVRGLGWVIGTRIKAERRGGGNCQCVRSVSTWDGNEFWEISFLKIGRACGSHLLGNSSLCYETIMCYDYISDKGYQCRCQIVSAEVFQHRRSSLCSSWLWCLWAGWGTEMIPPVLLLTGEWEVKTQARVARHQHVFALCAEAAGSWSLSLFWWVRWSSVAAACLRRSGGLQSSSPYQQRW